MNETTTDDRPAPIGGKKESPPTLADLLNEVEHQLLDLPSRLCFMEAFVEEIERATRGKTFEIWNDSAWLMALDHRDALLLHLAGWSRSMYGTGGFFGQVRARCLKELRRKRTWGLDKQDRHQKISFDRAHEMAFARLFPGASGPWAKPTDIDQLRDRFALLTKPVVDDRDNNRAHPYERQHTGTVKMLGMEEIRAVFDGVQAMLNDIRMVSSGSTFGYHDMTTPRSAETASVVVDLVLNGTLDRITLLSRDPERDAFYARLHELHDVLGPESGKLFNSAEVAGLFMQSRSG